MIPQDVVYYKIVIAKYLIFLPFVIQQINTCKTDGQPEIWSYYTGEKALLFYYKQNSGLESSGNESDGDEYEYETFSCGISTKKNNVEMPIKKIRGIGIPTLKLFSLSAVFNSNNLLHRAPP